MQRSVTLKSIFVLIAFTLGAGCASAEDGKRSFEDGLKIRESSSAFPIKLEHHQGHERSFDDRFEHRFEHHFGDKYAFEKGTHHNHGTGGGISVSPVSEPATDAMLLSGLVMLLALARRKSESRGV